MGQAIGQILPAAVAVAISPLPIIAVILMLFTPRARTNGPAFVVGWVLGLVVVGIVVLLVAGAADIATNQSSRAGSIIKLVLGLVLLRLAVRQWRGRPHAGEEGSLPKWMHAIDRFTPVKALGLGAVLGGLNPKNFVLAVAAATTLAQAGLSAGEDTLVWAIFVAIGTATVAAPVGYYLIGGDSAKGELEELRTWLGHNNATVMAVLLVVIGAKLIGDGITGLSS